MSNGRQNARRVLNSAQKKLGLPALRTAGLAARLFIWSLASLSRLWGCFNTLPAGKKSFSDEYLSGGKDDIWRIVRPSTTDGRHVVTVGQEVGYRRDMAQQLRKRNPEDATPLDIDHIPSEALPMAEALNGFFSKTNAMLTRERTFISDAAHELRTPLAGLRVQAQVAAQKGITEKTRGEALAFLLQGIDRCVRLVEQLLALSRLETMQEGASSSPPFAGLSRGAVD